MINAYPAAFDANDSLITAEALNYTGHVICENENINTINGIRFFKNVKTIQLDNNNISFMPAFMGFDSLRFISIEGNNITNVPSLTHLTNLDHLDVKDNNISVLPSFSGMSKLDIFGFGQNPITEFPDLTGTVIRTIAMNSTLITEFPDLSQYPTLQNIFISSMNLYEAPDFSGLNMNTISLKQNFFSFEDLLPIVNSPNVSALNSSQQMNTFTLQGSNNFIENADFVLTFPEDEDITTNRYVWYHNNTVYTETTTRTLTIPDADASLAGNWKVEVYNNHPYFDTIDYKLETYDKNMNFTPCFDGTIIDYQVGGTNCPVGVVVVLDEAQMQNYTGQLTVTLEGKTGKRSFINTTLFDVQEDTYTLTLEDEYGCKFTAPEPITISMDCDNVFTPDGDGRNDFFRYSLKGKVKIYSSDDRYITTLENNTHWDGKNQNGEVVKSGYYVLIDEDGNTTFVTVVH